MELKVGSHHSAHPCKAITNRKTRQLHNLLMFTRFIFRAPAAAEKSQTSLVGEMTSWSAAARKTTELVLEGGST